MHKLSLQIGPLLHRESRASLPHPRFTAILPTHTTAPQLVLVRRLSTCAAEGRTRKAANAVSRPSSLMPVTTREVERIAQEMAAHLAQQAALEESGGKTSHSLWLYTRKFVRLLLTKPVCTPPHPPSTASPPRLTVNACYIVPSALPYLWSMHPVIPPVSMFQAVTLQCDSDMRS